MLVRVWYKNPYDALNAKHRETMANLTDGRSIQSLIGKPNAERVYWEPIKRYRVWQNGIVTLCVFASDTNNAVDIADKYVSGSFLVNRIG